MPYAQSHYPFENKREFEDAFPADFIAEGTDQTRGWFYTLLVLSTALFNKAPFKVILLKMDNNLPYCTEQIRATLIRTRVILIYNVEPDSQWTCTGF